MAQATQEPLGIPFFSIKSGETHHCKLEPTIAAYINSSDMGINASRDQDYGWRLDPEWVRKIRAFKKDALQMQILTNKNGGQKPTTTQILYYIYGQQLARFYETEEENENPFEEAYLQAISSGSTIRSAADVSGMPLALADFKAATDGTDDEDLQDLIDDAVTDSDEDEPKKLTPEEQKAEDDALLAEMEAEEAKARAAGAKSLAEVEAEEKAAKEAEAKKQTKSKSNQQK